MKEALINSITITLINIDHSVEIKHSCYSCCLAEPQQQGASKSARKACGSEITLLGRVKADMLLIERTDH